MLCDCSQDAYHQQAKSEFGMEEKTNKDLICICSKDQTNQIEPTRRKRTPCLMDLVDHFLGGIKRPESKIPSIKKRVTSAPRQPIVETQTAQAPVAKAPKAPDSVAAKPVSGGDDGTVEAPTE